MADPRRVVSVSLFIVLGLVAAFGVSIVAGGDAAPEPDGGAGAGPAAAMGVEARSEVRVEVLNGAGRSGLARDATHRLREVGFDVVYFGNAGSFDRARSVVLDRSGRPERARAVAAALRIDSVASAPDAGLLLDVSVVLGDDWPPAVPVRRSLADRVLEAIGRIGGGSDGADGAADGT